jgi:hypothetical protein
MIQPMIRPSSSVCKYPQERPVLSVRDKLAAFYQTADKRLLEGLNEVDAKALNNKNECAEYAETVYLNMRQREEQMREEPDYLRGRSINETARAHLLSWIVGVHARLKLQPETLYLAASLTERYLAAEPVPPTQLQLAGTSALMLAAKYEEIYPPELKAFERVLGKDGNRLALLKTEHAILAQLHFDVSLPSPLRFLERFLKLAKATDKISALALYFLEKAFYNYKLRTYLPSLRAAAALYLAEKVLGSPVCWTPLLSVQSRYPEHEVATCARELLRGFSEFEGGFFDEVKIKYSATKFLEVSKLPIDPSLPL